jgi:arylsulfatase
MDRSRLQKILVVVGIALLLISGWLILMPGDADHERERSARSKGNLDDVLAFAQRDDFNVLFILVDTLRADHLSAYGYDRDTSPNMAALANSGIRFARNVSQSSWTKCSMASLWTGLYPARSRVLRAPHVVSEGAVMPAEIFREAGFRTAGIWRNGWIGPDFGFDQGFQTYTQPKPTARNRGAVRERPNIAALLGTDADLAVSARSFFRSFADERWFLYLHMMDVHQYVYTPDEALFGNSYLDIYDNSIRWVDRLIGELVQDLEQRGLRENTLIVIAADHGEAFNEHGNEGHARDVYGEVTETPFILSFPFDLDPGVIVQSRTANVDLWPTVFELLGLPSQPDPDGRSRVPEIIAAASEANGPGSIGSGSAQAGEDEDESAIFALLDQTWGRDREDPAPLVAVNHGRYRLFYSSVHPGRAELYDKLADPKEQHNLRNSHPEVVEKLSAIAEEHLGSPPAPWGDDAPAIEMNDMQLDQLRALGYGVE